MRRAIVVLALTACSPAASPPAVAEPPPPAAPGASAPGQPNSDRPTAIARLSQTLTSVVEAVLAGRAPNTDIPIAGPHPLSKPIGGDSGVPDAKDLDFVAVSYEIVAVMALPMPVKEPSGALKEQSEVPLPEPNALRFVLLTSKDGASIADVRTDVEPVPAALPAWAGAVGELGREALSRTRGGKPVQLSAAELALVGEEPGRATLIGEAPTLSRLSSVGDLLGAGEPLGYALRSAAVLAHAKDGSVWSFWLSIRGAGASPELDPAPLVLARRLHPES